jgi:hypothetical protein
MPDRRSVIGAGLMAGLGAAGGVEASPSPQAGDGGEKVADAVDELRREVATGRTERDPGSGIVESIRQQQRTFLKSAQKFPDYMDVGIRVWEDVYDWHVRFQQPMTVSRQPDGRYYLSFMQTTLILRPEQNEQYIGLPYDKDR